MMLRDRLLTVASVVSLLFVRRILAPTPTKYWDIFTPL